MLQQANPQVLTCLKYEKKSTFHSIEVLLTLKFCQLNCLVALQAARVSKDELEIEELANEALRRDVDRFQRRADLEDEARLFLHDSSSLHFGSPLLCIHPSRQAEAVYASPVKFTRGQLAQPIMLLQCQFRTQ